MKQFRYFVSNSAGDIITTAENGGTPKIRRTNLDAEEYDWYQEELADLKQSLETMKMVKDYSLSNGNLNMTTQHYVSMSSNNGYGNVVVEIVTFTTK